MGSRAEQLASKFEQSCREMETVVEGLSEADWEKVTAAEKWPVCVVAHHVALAQASISDLVRLVAKGHPVPHRTMDMINEGNAKHAREHGDATKIETVSLLKDNSAKAAGVIRGLSDAELDRSGTVLAGVPPLTAAQVIERILINHVNEHLGSIRATIGTK